MVHKTGCLPPRASASASMCVYVSAINSASWAEVRCHVDRGRTGTRLNIGRPQVRWHQGCELARAVKQEKGGCKKVSIGINTAIFSVLSSLRSAFDDESHYA